MSATNSTNQTVRFNIGDVSEQTLFEFMIYQIANITGGEVLNKDKISKVVSWLKNGKKESLMIIGGTGTGKTTLAVALAQAIGKRNYYPKFISMPKFERMCAEDNTWLDEVADWKYLLLDDVGTESREIKIYGNSRMLFNELIFQRYDRKLPMIITTNLSLAAFEQRYGEKVASRVRELFDIMVMNGKDLRK